MNETIAIARNCPRWPHCSVNNCPLDLGYPDLYVDAEDRQQKCTIAKAIRLRIAAKFPGVLVKGGLNVREYAAKTCYDRKPAAVKAAMAKRCQDTPGARHPPHARQNDQHRAKTAHQGTVGKFVPRPPPRT